MFSQPTSPQVALPKHVACIPAPHWKRRFLVLCIVGHQRQTCVYRLEGRCIESLKQTFSLLIHRHPCLRQYCRHPKWPLTNHPPFQVCIMHPGAAILQHDSSLRLLLLAYAGDSTVTVVRGRHLHSQSISCLVKLSLSHLICLHKVCVHRPDG